MANRGAQRLASVIATCFGLGSSPIAPGTAGSLGALTMAAFLRHHHSWGQAEFALLATASLAPGIWAAHIVAAASGKEDPSKVVVDEAIGQWVALAGATVYNWKSWLGAFLLFRLFDILKPPPVRQAERFPGGLGIVADDVLAGTMAALVLFAAGCFNLY